ncbi:MAG: lipid-A-disaccharide synthase [Elusimicrobia bacterium]|nr:lipid-A-disaccharide synthase [Elusimicrobiota bacterium]
MPRILVSAGEPSGDLLAAALVRQIKKIEPAAEIWAIGGGELAKEADVFLADLARHAVMGWVDPIVKLPIFWRTRAAARQALKNKRFDLVIPVDFYGFNIRLAALAKSFGCRVIYYVSPQIWASRPGRLQKIKRYVDKVLCLFPFEPAIYAKHGIPAVFVGHPLTEILKNYPFSNSPLTPHPSPLIGLMPGSRPQEIKRHWPILLAVWGIVHDRFPQTKGILFGRPEHLELYPDRKTLAASGIEFIEGPAYQKRLECELILTASGLACLENMILGLPMVIFYGVSPFWLYYILDKIVTTPFVGMPNILAGRGVVKEFTWPMTAKNNRETSRLIALETIRLLDNPRELSSMRCQLAALTGGIAVKDHEPAQLAAQEICSHLTGNHAYAFQ